MTPGRRAAALAGALALSALVSTGAAGAETGDDPPTFSTAEEVRLARGETVVRLVTGPGSEPSAGVAARVLRRDWERVWRTVADLDHWREWVPFLEVSERAPGPGVAWQLRFDLPLPLRDRHYRVTPAADRPSPSSGSGGTLSWESLPGSGNVAWARGSFTVTDRGDGATLVVFRTATDTGDRTPRFLLDRVLRESLPWVLEGLAQQVNRCRYTVPWPDGCREERPGSPDPAAPEP